MPPVPRPVICCAGALVDVAVGFGLMSSLPSTEAVPKEQYGFQAIFGMGFGLGFSSLIIVTRVEVDDDD